jgi:hypothetical protein
MVPATSHRPRLIHREEFSCLSVISLLHAAPTTIHNSRDWPSEPHDLDYYEKLGRDAGFEVGESRVVEQWFFLELIRR